MAVMMRTNIRPVLPALSTASGDLSAGVTVPSSSARRTSTVGIAPHTRHVQFVVVSPKCEDELQASAKPGEAIIQGWAVVDTHEGKNLRYTSPVEIDRDAEFERCLTPSSAVTGRLP